MTLSIIIFYFFAVLSIVCACLVVFQKNVMHSVLYLAFTILSVAGVFFTLQAEFLGAVQIMVYAGGIIVLYVFVIIIVNLKEVQKEKRKIFPKLFIICISLLFIIETVYLVFINQFSGKAAESGIDVKTVSETLLSKYIIPFELASVLLLAVLIGAIIIARRKPLHDSN